MIAYSLEKESFFEMCTVVPSRIVLKAAFGESSGLNGLHRSDNSNDCLCKPALLNLQGDPQGGRIGTVEGCFETGTGSYIARLYTLDCFVRGGL